MAMKKAANNKKPVSSKQAAAVANFLKAKSPAPAAPVKKPAAMPMVMDNDNDEE